MVGKSAMRLEGTTLKVYKFMLVHSKPVGVRELQRKLKLSSPSVAAYHLSKLEKLGLIEKNADGKYVVKRHVRLGMIKDIMIIGRVAFPRYVFYAVLMSSLTISYFYLMLVALSEAYLVGALIGVLACIILWKEAINSLKY